MQRAFPAVIDDLPAPPLALPGRTARSITFSRREVVLVAIGLGLLLVAQLILARYWVDVIDEGYFADLADRVATGQLPYRDFATPYTPGLHYVHAWAYGLLGRDLVSLRLLLTLAKTLLALVLYLLGRRLMPPAFAALPIVVLFGIDTVPFMWEPHPAWYALLFSLLAVWCITRLIETGSARWTLLAGVSAALACAFKQNFGALVLLAAAGFLLLHATALPGAATRLRLLGCLTNRWLWLAIRAAFGLLLTGALLALLRPYLDARLGAVFVVPVVMLLGAGLVSSLRAPHSVEVVELLVARLLALGGAFVGATLVWLVPLVLAVGPASVPLGQFVGALDLSGFYWELAEPRLGFALFLLAAVACPVAVRRLFRPTPFPRRLLEAVAFLLVAALATDLALVDTALATPDLSADQRDLWHLSLRAAETVLLYLPSLAFWGALLAAITAGLSLSRRARLTLRWYLLAGTLLLVNLYPRMDTMHVTFSGPLLFVVGSFALYRLFLAIDRRLPKAGRWLTRGLLYGSLLVLPAAAVLPNLEWRISSVVSREHGVLRFDPLDYVPFGIAGADVLVPRSTRDAIGGVVKYLQERTAPGEPIFVYPTLPLFYYLADRPNPTRFEHVYPGAATADELRELIATLETRRVRFVVWDQYWVDQWGEGGKFVLNRDLTDYLLSTYRTQAVIGPFHILARDE